MTREQRNYAVDDQYIPDRFTSAGTTENVVTEVFLGLLKNPRDHLSEIVWFKDGIDLTINEFEPDSVSIGREEVASNMPIAQTNATQIESWEMTPVIMAKYGSSFLNFLKVISGLNSGINNTRGAEILDYANGGIYYRKIHTFNKGIVGKEWSIEESYPYLKASSWPNPFSGKMTPETVHEFALLVENAPDVYYKGQIDQYLMIPANYTPVTITHDTVACNPTTFTIPALQIVDSGLIATGSSEGDVLVIVYGKDGNKITQERSLADGIDLIITGTFTGKVFYEIHWYISDVNVVPYEAFEVAVSVS